jgi:hypothetical protein
MHIHNPERWIHFVTVKDTQCISVISYHLGKLSVHASLLHSSVAKNSPLKADRSAEADLREL